MTQQLPQRRSPRLQGYDYSQSGAYFVTICTQNRVHLFGDVVDGEMVLNTLGCVVETCWDDLPNHYNHIELDAFVIMPNHMHGIIFISGGDGVGVGEGLKPSLTKPSLTKPSPTTKRHGLTEIVRGFKTFSARKINQLRDTPGTPVWQRSFHDHIIRDVKGLNAIRQYIATNPLRWHDDSLYS
jgi:putative transposase